MNIGTPIEDESMEVKGKIQVTGHVIFSQNMISLIAAGCIREPLKYGDKEIGNVTNVEVDNDIITMTARITDAKTMKKLLDGEGQWEQRGPAERKK